MTIGERIYKLRSEKGVSQETMAFDLNVSRQAVSKWETDQSLPDLDKIKLLSDYFEVSIDYLVKDVDKENIEKEELVESKYDANKIKRIVRIMLKTSILLSICYLVFYLIYVFVQKYLDINSYGVWVFVFPTVDFIQKLFTIIYIILISSLMLKRLKTNNNSSVLELVSLLIYYIGISIVLNNVFTIISQHYISSFPNEKSIIYVKLVNEISRINLILNVPAILLTISLIAMMITRKFDTTKYILPKERKEFKWSDALFSACTGTFLSIPGLLFEIVWLLDARSDNLYRFKKMRFWYIMGFIVGIVLNLFVLLIEII